MWLLCSELKKKKYSVYCTCCGMYVNSSKLDTYRNMYSTVTNFAY